MSWPVVSNIANSFAVNWFTFARTIRIDNISWFDWKSD